jgi:8-oxo-dGTP pyrophosphatase MutT (NUDIX family)
MAGKEEKEIALAIPRDPVTGLIMIGVLSMAAKLNGFGIIQSEYSFAGGLIDPEDENAEAAAVREAYEESGVLTSAVIYLGQRRRPDVKKVVHYVLCEPVLRVDTSQVIHTQPGEDIESFIWVPKDFILTQVPNLYQGVADYLKNH